MFRAHRAASVVQRIAYVLLVVAILAAHRVVRTSALHAGLVSGVAYRGATEARAVVIAHAAFAGVARIAMRCRWVRAVCAVAAGNAGVIHAELRTAVDVVCAFHALVGSAALRKTNHVLTRALVDAGHTSVGHRVTRGSRATAIALAVAIHAAVAETHLSAA